MKDGYKGDRVCMNCGQYDPNDVPTEEKMIPAAKTEHEGVLLPLFYDKNDKTSTTDRSSGKRYHFKAGSCTATGLKKYKCYVCNIVIREEIQPALGHDGVKDEANSTANITAYKCNRTDCVATKLENVAPEKFDIIITNGTATSVGSTISKAANGTVVTITADPAETGKQFDKWEVVYGGVTVADVNSATTTFTMGGEAVKIKVAYKDADPEHTRTYGEWVSDEANHWKACACSHIAELAAHTASDWIIDTPAAAATDGAKHREFTVCRRVLENETIPALEYTITFELNYSSGTATTAQTDKSGKLSALPAPSRSGYRFNGWYTVRSRSEHGKKLFSGGFFS